MKIKNNNRITLKWWNDNPPNKSGYVYNDINDESHNHSSLKKLGQLEDIEEDFGIDLIKLLTIKTVYYMGWYYGSGEKTLEIREANKENCQISINLHYRSLEIIDQTFGPSDWLPFSDYGKNDTYGGWAFTKEELL